MSTIITRNSANSGSTPASLVQGELAINVTDNRLFFGSGSGNIVKEFGVTSSYALQALSASYAISASYEINYETSSSYADFAVSASHALTASFITASNVYGPYGSNSVISASYALTASSALNAQDILIRVLNQSGNPIAKGLVVHITASGNSSDIPRVITASYENDNNSANTLGIANETIANGAEGFVMTEGVLKGIDTSAFVSGQLIYLGATGSIIGTAPVAPLHAVRLGQVVRVQSNNGSIYVRIDNGYEIEELHDVLITSASLGDLLIRSASVWINSKQLSGSYGLTGSLTISGSSTFTNIGPAIFSGSVTSTGGFTGSLLGTATTASYVLNAVSASFATTASYYGGSVTSASYALTATSASHALNTDNAITASYVQNAVSASYATQALSASYAPDTTFPYTGSAIISGSLEVTGSFTVQDSIDAANKILIGSGPIPGSTEDSVNWDSRTLFDSNGNFSVRWGALRTMYDANASQSVDWNNRLLKFDNGLGDYTVNWSSGLLRDTGSNNSVDWQNRITIDTGNKTSIDWQNRQLKDISGNETLNWQSGVKITGSLTVSGSSTLTNIGPARFSGSFVVQGDLIPGSPDVGPYDAIKVDDINFERKLYGSPFQGASASIDFGNRELLAATGQSALSWGGSSGTYETYLYNQQNSREATRVNLYGFNNYAGQILGDSYFDASVVDNDLVYLNTDGQWYQVDQTTDTSTKMLGIAKGIFSQTGSVIIEGDVVVSIAPGYPIVDNAGYGLPIYIKQGAGTSMDTTVPASGYVRIIGHCYWNSGGGGADEWIMKFRPSNDWYVI